MVDGIAVGSALGHVVEGGAAGTGQRQVALGRAVVGDRVGRTATAGGHTGNGRIKLALVDRVGGIDPLGNVDQAAIEVAAIGGAGRTQVSGGMAERTHTRPAGAARKGVGAGTSGSVAVN